MKYKSIIVLLYFLIFASLFAFVVPPLEGPDEVGHLTYINFIAQNSKLPNLSDNKKYFYIEGNQPPLYYILNLIFVGVLKSDKTINVTPTINKKFIWHGGDSKNVPCFKHLSKDIFSSRSDMQAFYLLRIFSIFISILNIYYVLKLSQFFLKDAGWNLFPIFFIATLPQYAFLSGMVNNDNLANLLATVSIYYLFRVINSPQKIINFVLLGISLSFGFLTKKSTLFLIPATVFTLGFITFKSRRLFKRITRNSFLLFIIILLISGWWFIRNYILYGDLGLQMDKRLSLYADALQERTLFSLYFLWPFIPAVFISFVGRLGACMNIWLPMIVYYFYLILFSLAIIGLSLYLREKYLKEPKIWLSLFIVSLCFIGLIFYNLSFNQKQGRYLFPCLSLIAILLTLGLKYAILKIRPRFINNIIMYSVASILFFIDLVSIVYVYKFYYRLQQYAW